MTQPLWTQRDAAQIIRDGLRSHSDKPNLILSQVPQGWTPDDDPVVTVISDGTPVSTRGWNKEVIRVTVHARDIPTSRKLMSAIDALLLTPMAFSTLVQTSPSTGIIAINDSKIGGGLSSATYNISTSKLISKI